MGTLSQHQDPANWRPCLLLGGSAVPQAPASPPPLPAPRPLPSQAPASPSSPQALPLLPPLPSTPPLPPLRPCLLAALQVAVGTAHHFQAVPGAVHEELQQPVHRGEPAGPFHHRLVSAEKVQPKSEAPSPGLPTRSHPTFQSGTKNRVGGGVPSGLASAINISVTAHSDPVPARPGMTRGACSRPPSGPGRNLSRRHLLTLT